MLSRRGRSLLLLTLVGLPLLPSCTKSEDTEPFIPATEGATQPAGGGARLTEDEACSRLLDAAKAARKRLGCEGPELAACPGFLRPGGGSGCYEYAASSVSECEKTYQAAGSCQSLSPCIATALRNEELATCELTSDGEGGAGSGGTAGAGSEGGAPPLPEAGAPGTIDEAGAPAGGAGG